MLGFHPHHTTRVVAEASGTWTRYAPANDHHRQRTLKPAEATQAT